MRHGVYKYKLNRNMGERKALMRSLLIALFTHEKITTTEAKAKILKPTVDRMISRAKKGDLSSRRLLLSQLPNEAIVTKVMQDFAPRFSDRPSGYTRLVHLGRRMSDSSPMVRIELVEALESKTGHKKAAESEIEVKAEVTAKTPKRQAAKTSASKTEKKTEAKATKTPKAKTEKPARKAK